MKQKPTLTLFLGIFIIFLTGCASTPPPTSQEMLNADYGSYPNNWQKLIKGYMSNRLIDPDSVKYKFLDSAPSKTWQHVMGKAGGFSTDTLYGWGTCFQYNAKNQMGGYVGFDYVFVIFKNSRIQYWGDKYGKYACERFYNKK